MNRKVFEIDARFKTKVVMADGQDINEVVKKFLFEHPERLEVKKNYICDAEDLGAWIPPPKTP